MHVVTVVLIVGTVYGDERHRSDPGERRIDRTSYLNTISGVMVCSKNVVVFLPRVF